jgi:hypothetical protein
MDLEDLFFKKHDKKNWRSNNDNHYTDNNYHYDNRKLGRDSHEQGYEKGRYGSHYMINKILSMLNAYPHKKALIAGVIILGFIILIVGMLIIFALLPLIMKVIYYVGENGIKGASDILTQSLDKILKGNG